MSQPEGVRTLRPGRSPAAGRRPPRVVTALVLASLLVVGAGLLGPGRAAAQRPPGAIPDAKVDAVIHADQIDLVARHQAAAVAAARQGLDEAKATLATDQAAVRAAEQLATDATEVRSEATVAVRRAGVVLGVARGAHERAVRAASLDRRQLQTLAIGWYTGGESVTPSLRDPLADSEAATDADTELTLLTGLTAATLRRDTALAGLTAARQRTATALLATRRAALAADVDHADHAASDLTAADHAVAFALVSLQTGTTTLDAAVSAEAEAVASIEGPEDHGARPVPTILGASALTAAQIVAWFEQMGYVAGTKATIARLAGLYVSEGRAEGVRGDVAFAQAIVETGGFESPDAIRLNNYAGIGHCDSCDGGLRFASPLAGVRSQIQLLRTYADPTLTSAELAAPPPIAALAPQDQAVRGCCRTWNALTGVWATDKQYGSTVLRVYAEMVAFAVAQIRPGSEAPADPG